MKVGTSRSSTRGVPIIGRGRSSAGLATKRGGGAGIAVVAAADATDTASLSNPVAITVIFISSVKVLIDHCAEDDVCIVVSRLTNDRRSSIHFKQRQIRSAGDVDQNTLGALDRRFFQAAATRSPAESLRSRGSHQWLVQRPSKPFPFPA